ncbi:hypothetical protein BHE97_05050 [Aeromicrobium sp. PE09-221]|uniref:DUF817 domain-containing protein n=1 Tax=Aeromicrobium sp. PE09-221 TaxID=1898043 RepID=UPI000B3E9170|nr:DUF817 domain-containing protein [Aeromicrobium sp. PE09-221]OUZ11214.1 hypothetical protein BHE97_05050 [Aeromicrobium sp. PE09-221]
MHDDQSSDDLTAVERRLHRWANAVLADAPADGARAQLVEFLVFGAKQAWACVFGAAMLVLIIAARLWYPDDAALARNDFLVIAAVAIQVTMIATKLETGRELIVIIMFHVVGTAMELFKTDVGSWEYPGEGVLHLGAVPLYTGFMYAAVGSYLVRVYRLSDLRFDRYPPRWITSVLAVLIYANFFTHHYVYDIRWFLVAGVLVLYAPTVMHFRVFRGVHRMPVLVAFVGVAFFIWIAENIGTASGAWLYPTQVDDWHLVSLNKMVSWFLLMIISVVMVTWVDKPQPPGR